MSEVNTELSLGEKRVRSAFNPSGAGNVNFIKNETAKMINVLEDFKNDELNNLDGEAKRLISLAQTEYENAAMWAVKAVTS